MTQPVVGPFPRKVLQPVTASSSGTRGTFTTCGLVYGAFCCDWAVTLSSQALPAGRGRSKVSLPPPCRTAFGGRTGPQYRRDGRTPLRPPSRRRRSQCRRAPRTLPGLRGRQGADALLGAERGVPLSLRGAERHPEHADGLGEIAGRLGPALRIASARAALGLHL